MHQFTASYFTTFCTKKVTLNWQNLPRAKVKLLKHQFNASSSLVYHLRTADKQKRKEVRNAIAIIVFLLYYYVHTMLIKQGIQNILFVSY